MEPSEKQIKFATSLGINVRRSMTREDVGQLIEVAIAAGKRSTDPMTEKQLGFAQSLGLTVDRSMTKGDASQLIDQALAAGKKAPDDGKPVFEQLRRAKKYGVTIDQTMTYRDAEKLIRAEEEKYPSAYQKELCKRLNVKINPSWTQSRIEEWLDNARQSPKFRDKFKEIDLEDDKRLSAGEVAEDDIESDCELRNTFGNKLVDDFVSLENRIKSDEYYVLPFKISGRVEVDVVELFDVEIVDGDEPHVKLVFFLPTIVKGEPDFPHPSLDWDIEKSVKVDDDLLRLIEKVDISDDNFDEVKNYQKVKAKFTKKFRAKVKR